MAKLNLDYVHTFYDARRKLRHVFRRKGHRQKTIKGKPGSQEFMDAYHALLDKAGGLDIGATRIKAGTVDALVLRYLKHDSFASMSPSTQATRRRIFDHFRECMTPGGRRFGGNRLAGMGRSNILDALKGKPIATQRDWLKAIRGLVAFAINEGELRDDPTVGIKTARPHKSSGYVTWTDEKIEAYRACHPFGTMARLALELMLNIAARRGDAYRLGRQHLRKLDDGIAIRWRPSKTAQSTGQVLTVPLLAETQAAIDALPANDLKPFLLTEHGKPFASAAAFGNRFADWCRQAGLGSVISPDGKERAYRAHGLRKAACTRLADAGASAMQIMKVSGHRTLALVQIYVEEADQVRMAKSAIALLAGSKPAQAVANNSEGDG